MLRGHRIIFNSLFPDDIKTDVPDTSSPERKGRSEMLILKRNELLICRYYYYVKMLGYQYPKALETLEDEMFIAERTIINIIQENRDILKHLHTSKAELRVFKKKFPAMVWERD